MLVNFTLLVFGDCLVFLISKLVSQVPQTLILVEKTFVVFHVAVKLNILLMKLDLGLLQLLGQ